MNGTQPDPVFVKQIRAALSHWKSQTRELDDEAIACLDIERQNLYRSIQYGLVLPETWPDAAIVVYQSFPLVEWRGYWREWIPVLNKVIASCPPDQPALQARFTNQLGKLHRLNHELDTSVTIHQEAEAIAQQHEDERLLAETYTFLSELFFRQNNLEAAESYGQQALALLTQMTDTEDWLAYALHTLGNVARIRRNSELAQTRLLEVVNIRRKQGASLPLARALNDLGMIYRLAGQQTTAYQTLSEAAELLEPSLYELDKSINRLNTGCLYYDDQQWMEAERYFRQADSTYVRQFSSIEYQARVNHHIGNALLRQTKYREATAYFERAITLWRQVGEEIEWANTLDSLGEAREGLGEAEMALRHYRKAFELLQGYPDHERARHLLAEITGRPLYRANR